MILLQMLTNPFPSNQLIKVWMEQFPSCTFPPVCRHLVFEAFDCLKISFIFLQFWKVVRCGKGLFLSAGLKPTKTDQMCPKL